MSGTESFASVFSHIVDIDLIQTINNVKSGLLTEQTAFGFDLFKQHGDKLRSLQQLIDAVSEDDGNDEKRQKVQTAIENLVSDIGLPFLRSFAPSFDGRAETAAAVLNICDFISVCLKRSPQKIGIEILELCLQSLIAFHNECEKHCENSSGEVVDVLCAIELLCTSLEVVSLSENNQNEDLLTKAFSASLSVLPHLEEKKANRLISFVIMKLTQDQAQRRSAYLQAVWTFIEEDTARQNRTVGPKSLQLHLTVMCSMANFFFPLTDEAVVPDVRQCPTFWKNVQLGLYSDNPAVRKRSIYLVKRIVDTCEKSALDFIPVKSSLDDPSAEVPYFLWSKPHQETLSRVWEDVFLLFETLDEKQTHVIKPILPRMQTLLNAAKIKKACPALHTSWIVTLLMRAFNHESVFIMRWAAETVLFMDFSSLSFLRQGQLQFLTEKLLGFLQDLKLYHRKTKVRDFASVCRSLENQKDKGEQFFASVCRSLENQKDKGEQFFASVCRSLENQKDKGEQFFASVCRSLENQKDKGEQFFASVCRSLENQKDKGEQFFASVCRSLENQKDKGEQFFASVCRSLENQKDKGEQFFASVCRSLENQKDKGEQFFASVCRSLENQKDKGEQFFASMCRSLENQKDKGEQFFASVCRSLENQKDKGEQFFASVCRSLENQKDKDEQFFASVCRSLENQKDKGEQFFASVCRSLENQKDKGEQFFASVCRSLENQKDKDEQFFASVCRSLENQKDKGEQFFASVCRSLENQKDKGEQFFASVCRSLENQKDKDEQFFASVCRSLENQKDKGEQFFASVCRSLENQKDKGEQFFASVCRSLENQKDKGEQFFASVCRSLENQKDKAQFVQHMLWTLRKENWSSVPLVFITQGLSCISPEPILDPTTLASVRQPLSVCREIIMSSLTTLETFTRGAIECFMAKMVLNLIDKSAAGVEDLMETLAAMQREESLQRGTTLWGSVVAWLVRSATDDPPHPAWTWPALQASLHALLDSYLTVTPDTSGHALSESLRVTKIGRLVTLMADCEGWMADCEGRMAQQTRGNTGPGAEEDRTSPLLTATLGRAVEVINSVNTRVYIPQLKADRAVYLLLLCAKEMKRGTEGKRDVCGEQLCRLAQSCWKELLLYVKRRVFDGASDDEGDPMELDQVVFYSEAVQALGDAIPRGAGLPSLQDLVHACTAVLHPPTTTTPSPTTPSTTTTTSTNSTLHHVAAVSLLSAVAQVLEAKLKGEGDREEGDREEGVRPLFSHLCAVIATMPVDCTVLAANRGAGSAHHGRLVSQYMVCQWQCVRVVLTHRPLLLQPHQVLRSALEAFSVSSGETDVPIMQCLEMVMPRLVGREEEEGRVEEVVEVVEVAWGKVHEEIKSWSFWLKMEAYVRLVLQRPLLCLMADPVSQLGGHMAKVLQRFFEVGQEKSGLLNLVMSRLCDLWGQEGGMTLALAMVPTIVDACMFGTLHKKAERLWLDVCMYIETLGEECSVNQILSSSSKNDIYVRLMTLNFLSALRPGRGEEEAVGRGVVGEAWSRYWALAQLTTFRQYTNTLPHRHKHRLVQTLPLLDHFIQEDCCQEFCRKIWEGLVVECHPSVRQNLEWLAMRLFHRFPSLLLPFLWDYFHQVS
ncbi:hypothetical protein ACOMHN_025218 [Nucella lapillus]